MIVRKNINEAFQHLKGPSDEHVISKIKNVQDILSARDLGLTVPPEKVESIINSISSIKELILAVRIEFDVPQRKIDEITNPENIRDINIDELRELIGLKIIDGREADKLVADNLNNVWDLIRINAYYNVSTSKESETTMRKILNSLSTVGEVLGARKAGFTVSQNVINKALSSITSMSDATNAKAAGLEVPPEALKTILSGKYVRMYNLIVLHKNGFKIPEEIIKEHLDDVTMDDLKDAKESDFPLPEGTLEKAIGNINNVDALIKADGIGIEVPQETMDRAFSRPVHHNIESIKTSLKKYVPEFVQKNYPPEMEVMIAIFNKDIELIKEVLSKKPTLGVVYAKTAAEQKFGPGVKLLLDYIKRTPEVLKPAYYTYFPMNYVAKRKDVKRKDIVENLYDEKFGKGTHKQNPTVGSYNSSLFNYYANGPFYQGTTKTGRGVYNINPTGKQWLKDWKKKPNKYEKMINEAKLNLPQSYIDEIHAIVQDKYGGMNGPTPQQMGQLMQLMRSNFQMQSGHEDELAEIGKEIILKYYGEILEGVELDIKIIKMGDEDQIELAGEMLKPSTTEIDKVEDLGNIDAEVDKRKIANNIIQGEAQNVHDMMYDMKDDVTRIVGNEDLLDNYMSFLELNKIGDWDFNRNLEDMVKNMPQGVNAVKVHWKEEKEDHDDKESEFDINSIKDWKPGDDDEEEQSEADATITVRALDLPMAIHEAVKGIYELIAAGGIDPDPDRAAEILQRTDTLADEQEDIRYGPFIAKDIRNVVNKIVDDEKASDIPNIREFVFGEMIQMEPTAFVKLITAIIEEDDSAEDQIVGFVQNIKQQFADYEEGGDTPSAYQEIEEPEYAEPEDIQEPEYQEPEAEEVVEPVKKNWVDLGQKELNYQLNIAIDNEDWETAKEIQKFLKEHFEIVRGKLI